MWLTPQPPRGKHDSAPLAPEADQLGPTPLDEGELDLETLAQVIGGLARPTSAFPVAPPASRPGS